MSFGGRGSCSGLAQTKTGRHRPSVFASFCAQCVCVCVRDAQGVTMRAWARITPLAAWLLDCVFSGLLHPPEFKCWSTANAPRCAQKIPSPMGYWGIGANPRRCWRNDCRWAESWCYGGRARVFLGWCGKGPPSRFLLQTCAAFASTSNIARPKTGPNEAHCGEFLRPGHHHQKAWQSGVLPRWVGACTRACWGPSCQRNLGESNDENAGHLSGVSIDRSCATSFIHIRPRLFTLWAAVHAASLSVVSSAP